jgi:hypothetical protein
LPRLNTARGDLSKDNSGSSKKNRRNYNVPEKLQELTIAEEGCNTAINHLSCGQAPLLTFFYCLNYVIRPNPSAAW